MAAESVLARLEAEFDTPGAAIREIVAHLEHGAPPLYIATYCRDRIDSTNLERVREIADRLQALRDLENRKQSLRDSARGRGVATPELESVIEDNFDSDVLDDVHHFLRRRPSRWEALYEAVRPLADAIQLGQLGDLDLHEAAKEYVNPDFAPSGPFGDGVVAEQAAAEADAETATATENAVSTIPVEPTAAEDSPVAETEPRPTPGAEAAPTGLPDADQGSTDDEEEEEEEEEEGEEAEADAMGDAAPVEASSTDIPRPEAVAGETAPAEPQATEAVAAATDSGESLATEAENNETAAEASEAVAAEPEPQPAPEPTAAPSIGTPDSVLEVVALVLSQRFADDMRLRARFRDELARGELHVRPVAPDKKGAKRYEQFFDKSEPIRRINPQRMLALRKGEREGIVQLRLDLPEGRAQQLMRERFSKDVDPESPIGRFLDLVYQHSYETYIRPACEKQARQRIKERADREMLRAFTRSVRAQLLAPPLGNVDVLVVRIAGKQVGAVHLAPDGKVTTRHSLSIEKDEERTEAIAKVAEMVTAPIGGIAIPHGRREGAARSFVDQVLAAKLEAEPELRLPPVFPVDETAAVVAATSSGGRRRMPNVEPGLRAAIALGRRLQDPLRELAGAEPRAFGLGHQLAEVHQGKLQRLIDATTADCVAVVGVEINHDSTDMLERVPGMTREAAKAIVHRRQLEGSFERLRQLEQMEEVGADRFEYAGGFLRLVNGADPLDATPVHPSDYPVAIKLAERKGVDVSAILGQRHRDVPLEELVEEPRGRSRTLEALRAIAQGATDPRGVLEVLHNEGLTSLADLKQDCEYQGRVTNMTDFGAFVDIGIGTDGLVHVSQIPASRLRDLDNPLRVGEVVRVYVQQVDADKKRISLTMIKPRHLAEGRPATLGERMGGGNRRGGRGHRGESEVQSRAARAPDRRGGRRGAPGRGRPGEGAGGPGGGRRGGGGRDRDEDFPRRGRGGPRVMTFEPEAEQSEKAKKTRGHKGELKSLAGLRNLLSGGGEQPSNDG
jgi:uncharacterized protein